MTTINVPLTSTTTTPSSPPSISKTSTASTIPISSTNLNSNSVNSNNNNNNKPVMIVDSIDSTNNSINEKSTTSPLVEPLEEETNIGSAGTGAIVDMEVFGQLLEIDDDDTHDFSKTLAFDYISQAETTFEEIDDALNKRDLDTLSRKGHFLKGSSAALGLQRVQHSCESMQHFGNRRDEHGEGPELSEELALNKCRVLLIRLRLEQEQAKDWMIEFFKA